MIYIFDRRPPLTYGIKLVHFGLLLVGTSRSSLLLLPLLLLLQLLLLLLLLSLSGTKLSSSSFSTPTGGHDATLPL
jgi:hypothetical protein